MKNLIKNEFRLFFGKKNIIISIFLILIMVLFYSDFTVNSYKNYYINEKVNVSSKLKNTSINVDEIQIRIDSLKELVESVKEIEHPREKDVKNRDKWTKESDDLNLELQRWKSLTSKLDLLDVMYENPTQYLGTINDTWKDIDDYIDKEIYEKNFKGSRNGLYLNDGRDWNSRKVLRKANAKIPLYINPEYPSGLKSVSNILSGENEIYIALFIFFIILANYDGWTNDFENNEGKIILTLPYRKSSIYFTRFFVRFLCSLGVIFFSILIVFAIASLKYGIGPNMKVLINELTIKNPFIFHTYRPLVWEYDVPVTLSKYILFSMFVFIFFILFIYSTINFVSILLRDDIGILSVGIILLLFVTITPYLKYSNIFSYYKVQDMIFMVPYYGYDWFWGIGLYTLVLALASFIVSIIGNIFFKRL